MPEYISCRSCDSPSCKGCNIYTLSTMLNNGKFDSLMNDNRSINPTANVVEIRYGEWVKPSPSSQECCKQCGKTPKLIFGLLPDYCPWCGAKMIKSNIT